MFEKNKILKFDIMVFFFGLIIILDGVVSIIAQLYQNEVIMYHLVRVIRTIIGIWICILATEEKTEIRTKYHREYFFIGIIITVDGILSIIDQITEPFLFQFGRIIRTMIGLFFCFYSFKSKFFKKIEV